MHMANVNFTGTHLIKRKQVLWQKYNSKQTGYQMLGFKKPNQEVSSKPARVKYTVPKY